MMKQFKEIRFENKNHTKSHFDLVKLEDILKLKPTDHNQFDFHRLSFYAILLHTQEEGVYNVNFKDYDFKEGTLFTLRKDSIHKFYQSKATGVLLIFTEDFILNNSSHEEVSKAILLFNEMIASPMLQLDKAGYEEIVALINLIEKEYFEAHDDYSLSIVRNYIQIIIAKLFRIKLKDNIVFDNNRYLSMFLQLQRLVERDCFNHKKVSFYAKEMGVTTKTLNNVTQNIVRQSAKALINEIVIIQSKRLIINSQDSLTEIAYQVGFEEPTNFFKYFKKYAGLSPNEFRRSCQAV